QFVRPVAMRLAGPALGGALVGVSAGAAFVVDAVSFAASGAAVLAMRPPRARVEAPEPAWAALKAGLRFVRRRVWPRGTLLAVACLLFNALEAAGAIVWATLKQRHVPASMLGRVSSLDWLISIGLLPLSFALTAPVAAAIGARATLVGAAAIGGAITLGALFLPGMRDVEGAGGEARARPGWRWPGVVGG